MTLFAELKRRNVIRMAGLYVVGSWLLVQVAGTVLPMFGAPDWIGRSVVVLLAIGFVPALVFAWIFELTPGGIRRDEGAAPASAGAPQTAQRMNRAIVAVLVLALGYFAVDKYVLAPKREAAVVAAVEKQEATRVATAAPAPVADKSIAVMPFLNMSDDPKQEYFSDGMTEEILNALANVPRLEVTARTSVFALKGKQLDVRELGKMLGVAYLLEGSVRKAGDEVRITAQLIRTDNGFHLWSETYDRKLQNVFTLQADLAGAIAQALQLPLGIGGDAALVSQRTTDPQAYALYLQARSAYRERGDGVQRSIDLYHAALARDPTFAPAWAGLCGSLNVLPYYLPDDEKSRVPKIRLDAEAAGKHALELAPDLASAHIMLGNLYTNEWKWALAEQHFQRAQALAPNDPEFYFAYTDWLAAQGRTEEALQAAKRAVDLDPMAPMYRNLYGYLLHYSKRYDEAIAQLQAGYALAPDNLYLWDNLFTSYIAADELRVADRFVAAERSKLLARGMSESEVARALAFPEAINEIARDPTLYGEKRKALGAAGERLSFNFPSHIDDLFGMVREQIKQHDTGVDPVTLLRSPLFADYRSDPRYKQLLLEAGFDENGNIR